MRTRRALQVLALLALASLAQADPITIQIGGYVTSASGSSLPASIYEGVTFSGSYTYDSATADSDSDPQLGEYLHDSPYGMSILVGGYEFKTAPDHTGQFKIEIGNDVLNDTPQDYYLVRSEYENISNPSLGFNISYVTWNLGDSTYDALSSDDLPTLAPILEDWDYNKLYISGSGSGIGGLTIEGTVTQVIPEPLTSIFLAIGALLIRHRR